MQTAAKQTEQLIKIQQQLLQICRTEMKTKQSTTKKKKRNELNEKCDIT